MICFTSCASTTVQKLEGGEMEKNDVLSFLHCILVLCLLVSFSIRFSTMKYTVRLYGPSTLSFFSRRLSQQFSVTSRYVIVNVGSAFGSNASRDDNKQTVII